MRSRVKDLIARPKNVVSVNQGPRSVGGFSSLSNRSDQVAQMEQYGAVGSLFAVVSRITDSVSQVPWGLYRKDAPGQTDRTPDAKRERVNVHPAWNLWENPNPFQTTNELVETAQQHYELTGEAWLLVVRNPRSPMPTGLWALRPDRIEVIPSATTFIAGYIYRAPDGEKVPLGIDDLLLIRNPNPLDPYRGIGPVQTIMAELEGASLSAEWNRNFFLNNAQPGGIIQIDHRMDDDEFKEYAKRWDEQHRGVSKAHRVAVIEGGTWVDSKFSMMDMQFVELRRSNTEEVLLAFGFPKSKIGIVTDVNRANAEAADVMYAKDLTRPRLTRWKAALNKKLLPMFGTLGKGVEFDFKDPVLEDSASENQNLLLKATASKLLADAGWKPDDVLAATGLPGMEFIGRAAKVGGESLLIDGEGNVTVAPAPPAP